MADQNPTVPQVFQIANQRQWDGKLAEAEDLYRKILQIQPGHTDVLVNLASLAFVAGRQEEALAIISTALNKNPSSPRAYAQRDRMNFVRQRAANPQTKQDVDHMRQTIAAMETELRTKEIYVPSAFWTTHGKIHVALLELYGLEYFKRTVTHTYQNWLMQSMTDPQVKRLIELWPTHLSSRPFSNTMEKPDDIGMHLSLTYPFYVLSAPQNCEIYKLAVSLLWEYTLAMDTSHKLATLEESPIGSPLALRRDGKLISSDLCHSIRERNQMLQAAGLTGSEGLLVAELGAGSGRLAEVFALTTNYRYIILDVTPALYVSQWYIKQRFPNEKIFQFRHFKSFSEIESELRESRFAFFTANQIELLPPKYVDLFVNVNSLMEMQHDQRTNFLTQIDRVTREQFFSQQWFRWDNALDKITVTKADFKLGPDWTIAHEAANVIHSDFFVQIWKRARLIPSPLPALSPLP